MAENVKSSKIRSHHNRQVCEGDTIIVKLSESKVLEVYLSLVASLQDYFQNLVIGIDYSDIDLYRVI